MSAPFPMSEPWIRKEEWPAVRDRRWAVRGGGKGLSERRHAASRSIWVVAVRGSLLGRR